MVCARVLLVALVILLVATFAAAEGHPRILKLAELNTEKIRVLNRDKTVFLIPGGILEQHGPYLLNFRHRFMNEWITEQLARAVVARPGWTAVIMPTVPLGVGGANEIGGQFSFPGTYAVRSTTLRAVFVDLGSELGDQGFRWLFVVHLHGAPMHSHALDDAGEYFRDTYGGHMVHLFGLMPVYTAGDEGLAAEAEAIPDFDVHAGTAETSDLLFLRPDLVAPGYRAAPPLLGKDWTDLVRIARTPEWPGYFSAPAEASVARGRASLEAWARAATDNMLKILDGADERRIPHYASIMAESAANVEIDRASAAHERAREDRFSAWLSKREAAAQASHPTSR